MNFDPLAQRVTTTERLGRGHQTLQHRDRARYQLQHRVRQRDPALGYNTQDGAVRTGQRLAVHPHFPTPFSTIPRVEIWRARAPQRAIPFRTTPHSTTRSRRAAELLAFDSQKPMSYLSRRDEPPTEPKRLLRALAA